MKFCRKCGIETDRYPSGKCRPCELIYRNKPENQKRVAIRKAAHYQANHAEIRAQNNADYAANKVSGKCVRCANLAVLDRAMCAEHLRADSVNHVERTKHNLFTKICTDMRNRLNMAIRNKQKSGSAVRDLGCSIAYFVIYLEGMFQPGMTWENWGEWHIDHIKPFASINVEDREQLLTVLHYTNLQPLWAVDNLKKGAKYVSP